LVLNYRDIKHPLAGGAEVHLHRIFGRIVKQGHEVFLRTTSFAGAAANEVVDGIQVFREGGDWDFNFRVFRKLPQWVKECKADIVVEDLNKLPFWSKWRSPVPVLVQMHHLWGTSIFSEASFPVAFYVWIQERMIPFAFEKAHFAVVSPSTSEELAFLGVDQEKIRVIYNGLEEGFLPAENTKGESYFLWLGRLRKYKGIMTALEAFAKFRDKYPNVHLRIAGSGPDKERIIQWIKERELDNHIHLEGFVSEEKKLELLQGALAVLQTSRKEGWGLTVIEANACRVPVIATDVPGLRDSVKDGVTGVLCPWNDADAFADKMAEMMDDSQKRELWAAAALKHAQSFSWDRAAIETLSYLEEILADE
jgi:glycosyltransferase involved in cell wall biosynthesis